MRIRCTGRVLRVALVALLLSITALVLAGCGADETVLSTSPSVASTSPSASTSVGTDAAGAATSSTSTSTAGGASSTSASLVTTSTGQETTTTAKPTTTSRPATTTTTKPTTTTVKSTTTTVKPTTTTAKATTTTAKPTTTTAKADVVLTLSGPGGTKELSMADLKALSATSGYGGWKNQLGNITAPAAYKGVTVNKLLDLVGGGGSALVTASDGYQAVLSGSELSGQCNMYDPASGEAITGISGSVKVILAYSKNGKSLSSGDGPLRIAFVSPEKDQVTDSDQWVKSVTSIKAR